MKKKRVLAAIVGVIALLAVVGDAHADDGYYWSTGDQSTGGGTGGHYNGWNWTRNVLAWFEYEYESSGTASASDTTVPLDPAKGTVCNSNGRCSEFGPSGAKVASVPGMCRAYSTSFFVSGYVGFNDNGSNTYPRNAGYWELASGLYHPRSYTGLYLGLLSNIDTSVYVTQEGEVTRASKPAGIKKISVVSPTTVQAVWNDLVSKGLASGEFGSKSAFCGGQLATRDSEGYYGGHARIRVIASDVNGSHDESAYDNNKTLDLKGSASTIKVKFRGYGYSDKDKSKAITSGYEEYGSTNFTLTTKLSNSNDNYSKRDVTGNTATDGYNSWPTPNEKDGEFELSLGDSVTVCTNNEYHKHYKNGWTDEKGTKSACYTVTYSENTKVNLGSVSAVGVSGKNGDANVVKKAMDIEESSRGLSNLGTVFGNEQFGTAINSGYPKTIDGNNAVLLNPGIITVSATNKITKEGIVGTDADVTLRGISVVNPVNNNGCSSSAVLSKGSNYKDCYNASSSVSLYPQETKTLTAKTEHPKQISASSVTDSAIESSEASITVKGNDIICKDFNNAKVGIQNRQSYGRIAFMGSNTYQNSVGDMTDGGWQASQTKWLKSGQPISLTYYGCDGNLIARDYAGEDTSTHQYAVLPGSGTGSLVEGLYIKAGGAVKKDSAGGANIMATELGGSTANARLASSKQYQFTAATKTLTDGSSTACKLNGCIDLLGHEVSNSMSWISNGSDTKTAALTLKEPYNYYMKASLTDEQSVVFLGEPVSFTVTVKVEGRVNAQVNTGVDNPTNYDITTGGTTITKTKKTKIATGIITLDEGVSVNNLSNFNENMKGIIGDHTSETSIKTILRDITGESNFEKYTIDDGPNGEGMEYAARSSFSESISFEGVKERVGQKICAVVAIYPTDSHDTGDGRAINDSNQSAALNGPNPNSTSKTSITISCATVGKKPATSIEGGDAVSAGVIKGASTKYDSHIFGSWSEYGLISLDSLAHGFGSGASLMGSAFSGEGLENGKSKYPQSLGNANRAISDPERDSYGTDADTIRYFELSRVSVDALRSVYIDNHENMPNVVYMDNIDALPDSITEEGKIFVVDYSKKTGINANLTISKNIENNTKSSVVVINTTGNIKITNDVARIDATLLAYRDDRNDGTIDTCSGDVDMFDGKTNRHVELDQEAYYGNQHLLRFCSNPLRINGSVFARKIRLDRAYGGGSRSADDDLDPSTLFERAEIFSYDPRILLWAYNANTDSMQSNAVYVKELTPRL